MTLRSAAREAAVVFSFYGRRLTARFVDCRRELTKACRRRSTLSKRRQTNKTNALDRSRKSAGLTLLKPGSIPIRRRNGGSLNVAHRKYLEAPGVAQAASVSENPFESGELTFHSMRKVCRMKPEMENLTPLDGAFQAANGFPSQSVRRNQTAQTLSAEEQHAVRNIDHAGLINGGLNGLRGHRNNERQ
jgi:hypothetical protein